MLLCIRNGGRFSVHEISGPEISIQLSTRQISLKGLRGVSFSLSRNGCDAPALLDKVGLADRCKITSVDRIPFALSEPLWNLAAEETGDPCIGLEMHRLFNSSTFHALAIALLASSSLQDALHQLARYGKILRSAGEKSLTETSDNYYFHLTVVRNTNGMVLLILPPNSRASRSTPSGLSQAGFVDGHGAGKTHRSISL